MPSDEPIPLRARLVRPLGRIAGAVGGRWRRWRAETRPLPGDWWPEFEREFRAYCAASGRRRRTEPDR